MIFGYAKERKLLIIGTKILMMKIKDINNYNSEMGGVLDEEFAGESPSTVEIVTRNWKNTTNCLNKQRVQTHSEPDVCT